MSLAGAIADARKSATRMYINNFADKGRQNTIDLLLVSDLRGSISATKLINGRAVWSTNTQFAFTIQSMTMSIPSFKNGLCIFEDNISGSIADVNADCKNILRPRPLAYGQGHSTLMEKGAASRKTCLLGFVLRLAIKE